MVTQISADRLAERLDADETFFLVDTRPEESFEAWHIPGAENVPYDPREGPSRAALAGVNELSDGRPVVTVCGKGLTSTTFAFELEKHGYEDVTVVKGGMEDWSELHEAVRVGTTTEGLAAWQVQRRGTGCLGYVVGSSAAGEAAVIDPTRRTDAFELVAQRAGMRITRVFDTHVHADHVSGGPGLAERLDVPYHLGEHARERGVEHAYDPLADGDVVEVGDVAIEAIHAPGHTTEMLNYHVADELLLTGDTLFVDSVGRTELQFGDEDAATGARLLHGTLHDGLLDLPADTLVLPGHVTVTADGRFEGGSPGEVVSARLGDLREGLDLLDLDEAAFVDRLTGDPPEKPANYETVIGINLGERDVEEAEARELELGPNACAA